MNPIRVKKLNVILWIYLDHSLECGYERVALCSLSLSLMLSFVFSVRVVLLDVCYGLKCYYLHALDIR